MIQRIFPSLTLILSLFHSFSAATIHVPDRDGPAAGLYHFLYFQKMRKPTMEMAARPMMIPKAG
jgi:hypothetical protein